MHNDNMKTVKFNPSASLLQSVVQEFRNPASVIRLGSVVRRPLIKCLSNPLQRSTSNVTEGFLYTIPLDLWSLRQELQPLFLKHQYTQAKLSQDFFGMKSSIECSRHNLMTVLVKVPRKISMIFKILKLHLKLNFKLVFKLTSVYWMTFGSSGASAFPWVSCATIYKWRRRGMYTLENWGRALIVSYYVYCLSCFYPTTKVGLGQ